MPTATSRGYTAVPVADATTTITASAVNNNEASRERVARPIAATVIPDAADACHLTRPRLHELLKEAEYGAVRGAYAAYFREDPSGDGGHLCRVCGRELGAHPEESEAPQVALVVPSVRFAELRRRMEEPITGRRYRPDDLECTTIERPLHWRHTAWYARLLDFDGFGPVDKFFASTRWRCVAPGRNGGVCGATFTTDGFRLEHGRLAPGTICSLKTRHDAPDTIEKHFNDVHKLEHQPGPGWTTSLFECHKASPAVALSCLFGYCWPAEACNDDAEVGSFFDALNRAAPRKTSGPLKAIESRPPFAYTRSAHPDYTPCAACAVPADLMTGCVCPILVAPALAVCAAGLTVLTLGGFPCAREDFGPIVCWTCFERRRRFVSVLNAAETPTQTRAITMFCCPCSEIQQYRELVHSGVWPGLLCCQASTADRAAMAPAAVRARYGVDGFYGVRPTRGAGNDARRLAASLPHRDGPAVQIASHVA
eukprot:CAMPEP_0174830702 /NCGR_PEP_ID=MMETSP1114-20130205/2669_1 /TAXON_ID=312471 /ORGANISM="Neobodo designis, Strain CCAP 1951/1" /LENGTH=481 /DNA_ID=CAMNT_0016064505 /DNA_START=70 /DNA_END=1515 /DNA_ORIENTATION=+